MRTVGIIAEYNPLHKGHAYHIQKARELAGADYVIVVMSPDFVQRGEPAVFDKYARAQMALLCGADLVLELPVCYATGSAEYFAEGAVKIFDQLSITDSICFGTEGPAKNAGPYLRLAGELNEEPEKYKESLKENLKKGMSFPEARSLSADDPEKLLSMPNASLGVEYCRALIKFGSDMTPIPLKRVGNGYLDESAEGDFCSAMAIRKALLSCDNETEKKIYPYIPSCTRSVFEEEKKALISADDFLPFLIQKLLYEDSYDGILDIRKDLSRRMKNLRYLCVGKSFEEIVSILQTKQVTKSRIRRALLHLILDIRLDDVEEFRKKGTVYYARILGFKKESSKLLHEIKKKSKLPLIAKTSDAPELLDDTGKKMWDADVAASHLYGSVRSKKNHLPFRSEYEKSPVIL